MQKKLMFAVAGLLAICSTAFAADGWNHGYRGGEYRGGYHEYHRDWDRGRDWHHDRGWGYGGGSGFYFGVTPGYYSGYVAPAPYVDPYAYTAPAPYTDGYAAPYPDEYVGPPPFAGAIWIGGYWGRGGYGRYWVRGHWGRRY